MYNGQWQGKNKQGLGVYRYPGGARYEGEWRNNFKEGRGVYTFPKVSAAAAALSIILVYSLCTTWDCSRMVQRVWGFTKVMAWAERGAEGPKGGRPCVLCFLVLHLASLRCELCSACLSIRVHRICIMRQRSLALCCLVWASHSNLGNFAQL